MATMKKKKRKNRTVSLQITSMMDMFTIILVYLLTSFNNDPATIKPNAKVVLPTSVSIAKPIMATKIFIAKDKVLVNDGVVMELDEKSKFKKADVEGLFVKDLSESLKKVRESIDRIAEVNDDAKFKGEAIIIADRSIPFETVRNAMFTAGQESFSTFHFAVIKSIRKD